MNFAHSLMTRLNDAAGRIGSGVRELYTPHQVSAGYERLRDALLPTFDQFVETLAKSGRAVGSATAPYLEPIAESAKTGAEMVHDKSVAGAQAIAEMVQNRRGLLFRHPYLVVIAIAGTGYLAVQQWRKHAAQTSRPARSRSSARTAAKTPAARRTPAARAANARTQRERRARSNAEGAAADKIH